MVDIGRDVKNFGSMMWVVSFNAKSPLSAQLVIDIKGEEVGAELLLAVVKSIEQLHKTLISATSDTQGTDFFQALSLGDTFFFKIVISYIFSAF